MGRLVLLLLLLFALPARAQTIGAGDCCSSLGLVCSDFLDDLGGTCLGSITPNAQCGSYVLDGVCVSFTPTSTPTRTPTRTPTNTPVPPTATPTPADGCCVLCCGMGCSYDTCASQQAWDQCTEANLAHNCDPLPVSFAFESGATCFGGCGGQWPTPTPNPACDTVWIDGVAGSWGTSGNWSNGVPDATKNCCFTPNSIVDASGESSIACKNMDWRGATGGSALFTMAPVTEVAGDLILIASPDLQVNPVGADSVAFTLSGTGTVTTAGQPVGFHVTGTYSLADDWTSFGLPKSAENRLTFDGGSFDFGNHTVTINNIYVIDGGDPGTCDFDTANITIRDNLRALVNWVPGTATITMSRFENDFCELDSATPLDVYNMHITHLDSPSFFGCEPPPDLQVDDDVIVEQQLTIDPDTVLSCRDDNTIHTNLVTMSGTSGHLVTVGASVNNFGCPESGVLTFDTAQQIVADYLDLHNAGCTGAGPCVAGTHSTDSSGNTGWCFDSQPNCPTWTPTSTATPTETPTPGVLGCLIGGGSPACDPIGGPDSNITCLDNATTGGFLNPPNQDACDFINGLFPGCCLGVGSTTNVCDPETSQGTCSDGPTTTPTASGPSPTPTPTAATATPTPTVPVPTNTPGPTPFCSHAPPAGQSIPYVKWTVKSVAGAILQAGPVGYTLAAYTLTSKSGVLTQLTDGAGNVIAATTTSVAFDGNRYGPCVGALFLDANGRASVGWY